MLALKDIAAILAISRVSWINVMPRPLLNAPQFHAATPESFPLVLDPAQAAPIVAVIDSGVRSAHPIIAPAIIGVEHVGEGLGDGGDESGHGTLVASLALFGSLEKALDSKQPLTPAGRLLSIRVLNRENKFHDDVVWPQTVMKAMYLAAEAGARVINLSFGDNRRPYQMPRPTAVGALVDEFIREHPDLVVVTCVGNFSLADHTTERLLSAEYIEDFLSSPIAGLLDPGTALLSLTVGGLGAGHAQGAQVRASAEIVAVGGPDLPSPFTRIGPGPMAAIKPEMSAPSGSVVVDTLMNQARLNERSVHVVGAGGAKPDHLLASSSGTSFAAPLVSHAALRILGRYPDLNGNSVRALLLVGSEEVPNFFAADNAKSRTRQRQLVGYGAVSARRSEVSDDFRVVLLNEGSIELDQVHFYKIPIPPSFREAGGWRRISVALAYDPPVRVTRLDYLANRMGFQIFHGPTLAKVRNAYVRAEAADEIQENVEITPQELSKYQLNLQPSNEERSRGTNQLGRYIRPTKIDDDKPDEYILAVRSLNRWDTPDAIQNYSIAVTLQRDELSSELYADLRAELEPLSIEVETELEVE